MLIHFYLPYFSKEFQFFSSIMLIYIIYLFPLLFFLMSKIGMDLPDCDIPRIFYPGTTHYDFYLGSNSPWGVTLGFLAIVSSWWIFIIKKNIIPMYYDWCSTHGVWFTDKNVIPIVTHGKRVQYFISACTRNHFSFAEPAGMFWINNRLSFAPSMFLLIWISALKYPCIILLGLLHVNYNTYSCTW